MARLTDVAERLGLDPDATEQVARYKTLGVWGAMRELDLENADAPEQAARLDYLTTQGMRAIGLMAIVDQNEGRVLGEKLAWRLAEAGRPSWPLGLALATMRPDAVLPAALEEAGGYPADLVWLLLDPGLELSEPPPATDRRLRGFGRAALAPYRIDLRLLRAVARGGNTTQFGMISEPSAPAVVGALFGSMEDALAEARSDEAHWAIGASPIAPTDPEVLLAVRIVLRSPAGWALRDVARTGEIRMISAIVDLVDAVEHLPE